MHNGLIERVSATLDGWRYRRVFAGVRSYAMFVGYPRSGHSLVGAFLNAHPRMVIAHELDALKFVSRGYTRAQLFSTIIERDRWWRRNEWKWEGWEYEIPGQWQGRWNQLSVVGDKAGGLSSRQIVEQPSRLSDLQNTVSVPVMVIHHVRNPFDTIATMSRKGQPGISTLDEAIDRYFVHCRGSEITLEWAGKRAFTLHHEALTTDPRREISRLCGFLGEAAEPEYLDACAARAHSSPRRSRALVNWTPLQLERVQERIRRHPFLAGYRFES